MGQQMAAVELAFESGGVQTPKEEANFTLNAIFEAV